MKLLLLISYDIADDKGRTKIAKQLEQFGFERLQYSVFAGSCTQPQWNQWKRKLQVLFDKYKKEGDKLYAIPQSEKLFKQAEQQGATFDVDWVMGKTQVLYI